MQTFNKKRNKTLESRCCFHDGAPNVGGQWSKDSYNQNELVLFSIKLAVEFLKEGGWFIGLYQKFLEVKIIIL